LQNKILTQNFSKKLIFKTEDNVPVGVSYKKKYENKIFLHPYSRLRKESGLELDLDPLVRGTVRIRGYGSARHESPRIIQFMKDAL
jgi:hypothetical protein